LTTGRTLEKFFKRELKQVGRLTRLAKDPIGNQYQLSREEKLWDGADFKIIVLRILNQARAARYLFIRAALGCESRLLVVGISVAIGKEQEPDEFVNADLAYIHPPPDPV
jgi:hypothetical protein